MGKGERLVKPSEAFTLTSGQVLHVRANKEGEIIETNHAFRLEYGLHQNQAAKSLFTLLDLQSDQLKELFNYPRNEDGSPLVLQNFSNNKNVLFYIYNANQELYFYGLNQDLSDHHYTSLISELTIKMGNMLRESHKVNLELKHSNEKVLELSETDGLTHLLNHTAFMSRAEVQIKHNQRYNHPCSLLMADIDHFKLVNDQYGHQAGDSVLEQLGQLLLNEIRIGDIAARYGGEEFVIFLPNTTSSDAQELAERIRSGMESLNPLGKKHPVTISLGIAQCQKQEQLSELISKADQALYNAKNNGRNRVCTVT